jgi:hypothetical protein
MSRAGISNPHAIADATNKRLISRAFLKRRIVVARVERQTMPRQAGQVLPLAPADAPAKRMSIARQILPDRQILPGRSCRHGIAHDAKKPAIYRAF